MSRHWCGKESVRESECGLVPSLFCLNKCVQTMIRRRRDIVASLAPPVGHFFSVPGSGWPWRYYWALSLFVTGEEKQIILSKVAADYIEPWLPPISMTSSTHPQHQRMLGFLGNPWLLASDFSSFHLPVLLPFSNSAPSLTSKLNWFGCTLQEVELESELKRKRSEKWNDLSQDGWLFNNLSN